WPIEHRAELLADVSAGHAKRLMSPKKGAKPPSHLAALRSRWDMATRWISACGAVQESTRALPAAATDALRAGLPAGWREVLEQKEVAPASLINRALVGKTARAQAFVLLYAAEGNPRQDPADLLRSLKRVKLPTPW